eukprot:12896050-Prorocentrum_lima.AAC.1
MAGHLMCRAQLPVTFPVAGKLGAMKTAPLLSRPCPHRFMRLDRRPCPCKDNTLGERVSIWLSKPGLAQRTPWEDW